MGMYDVVVIACPRCGELYDAQSKGGDCTLSTYTLEDAPPEVLTDINRHAPFSCTRCGANFKVLLRIIPIVQVVR